ncbi:MAG TPA: sialate O-acetylesterase [Planctomycetota bacterium]|nr:sialate O-acetylesterase [Planctomycetota bacterium]
MRKSATAILVLVLAALGTATEPRAELKLHSLFADHMVLQADFACPVWGTVEPGEDITVSIAGHKKTAKANADGKWSLKLDPMKSGGPHEMTVAGRTSVTVQDVLIGEVWVCSGQSNMEMVVSSCNNFEQEKAAANFPNLRHFLVKKNPQDAPVRDVSGSWKATTPETVGGFTAVGYFFGRELNQKLNVPIGLIHTSWGGTAAELWTSRPVLEGNDVLKPIAENFPKRMEAYEKQLAKFKEDSEKAKAENKPAPKAPNKPMSPSCLYNGMIAPIIPYGIKGAIWYQGESNAGGAKQYQTLFPEMIKNWRTDWGQGDFPFGFVQLANFKSNKNENLEKPVESNWAELREAQTMTLSLPHTGMAVIIDIGHPTDIHPKNKQDVGKRLSLWAQSQVYGKELPEFSSPLFDSIKVEDNKARIAFKHAGGGLEAKGDKLTGFAIAGEDRNFVWADAKIDGASVVVSSDQVAKPVAVRYAWADYPECNLYSKEGLPASPFRTDTWPRK